MKISTLYIASNIFILSALPVSYAKTFEESPADPTTHAVSQPLAQQPSTPTEITPRIIRAEPNSYIGLAFGRSNFEFPEYNYEPEGNIGGIYLGTDINEWFGFESAIMLTGNIAINDMYEAATAYWSFTPTARMEIGPNIDLFIKGGFASMAYVDADNSNNDLSGWTGTAGAGIRAQFTDFNFRLGVDYLTGTLEAENLYNVDVDVDVMVFTGGIEYRF